MKINTVKFISSSDIFDRICKLYDFDWAEFRSNFSDACTSVGYGEATHTLINVNTFSEILSGMEEFYNKPSSIVNVVKAIPDGVLIDLET